MVPSQYRNWKSQAGAKLGMYSARKGQLGRTTQRQGWASAGAEGNAFTSPHAMQHGREDGRRYNRECLQGFLDPKPAAGRAPIMRDLTTSTGDPTHTARKPAPRPATTCVGRLSVKKPVEISDDFICGPPARRMRQSPSAKPPRSSPLHVQALAELQVRVQQSVRSITVSTSRAGPAAARAQGSRRVIARQLHRVDDGIARDVGPHARPQPRNALFPAVHRHRELMPLCGSKWIATLQQAGDLTALLFYRVTLAQQKPQEAGRD